MDPVTPSILVVVRGDTCRLTMPIAVRSTKGGHTVVGYSAAGPLAELPRALDDALVFASIARARGVLEDHDVPSHELARVAARGAQVDLVNVQLSDECTLRVDLDWSEPLRRFLYGAAWVRDDAALTPAVEATDACATKATGGTDG